jgi:hypothetical protein
MKSIELALKAGRLLQSPVTHFIHYSNENPEHAWETIPMYENFCFALSLFRTKIAENILEGKALLEKLFAFQTAEGFPIYLHEYPVCKSRKLGQKLSVVSYFLLRDFAAVLGEGLRAKLQSLIIPLEPLRPNSPEEWADFLIQTQISGEDPSSGLQFWDAQALCFLGPQKQERGEPAVTLYDLILGEWTGRFSKRALLDYPTHLQASLIYPKEVFISAPQQQWTRRFWGEGSPTHSALLHTQGSITHEENVAIIDLPAQEVHDAIEISYFLNKHPEVSFTVNGTKSTTFQMDDTIFVQSGATAFEITFSLVEGEGRFWGHLYFGNRPGQIGCKGPFKYEAFDWIIALRTIERTKAARIKITFQLVSNISLLVKNNE